MRFRIFVSVCLLSGFIMNELNGRENGSVVTVADFADQASFTSGIQEAIDALPKEGGTVIIPGGTYTIRRSVLLRSGVTVRGQGSSTVIKRPAEFRTKILKKLEANAKTAVLNKAGILKQGDQVFIKDRVKVGWHGRHAVITAVQDNKVTLENRHRRGHHHYLPSRGAFCANWFPAFWLWDADSVCIEDLTIDGNIEKHRSRRADFVVAAVHTRGGRNISVINITVQNWPGDGISIQKTDGAMINGCTVENCRGHGLHPGSGAVNTIWEGNMVRNNTRDGFFFCVNVKHAAVKNNLFLSNGQNGIGGLGKGDRYNIVSGNICAGNAFYGIEAAHSICNIIQGNVCRNNCTRRGSAAIFLKNHRDNIVRDNLCIDDRAHPSQKKGVISQEPSGENIIENNHVALDNK